MNEKELIPLREASDLLQLNTMMLEMWMMVGLLKNEGTAENVLLDKKAVETMKASLSGASLGTNPVESILGLVEDMIHENNPQEDGKLANALGGDTESARNHPLFKDLSEKAPKKKDKSN